jgi:hypothetical protein
MLSCGSILVRVRGSLVALLLVDVAVLLGRGCGFEGGEQLVQLGLEVGEVRL